MRKLLSFCSIWVLFEEATKTQKVSYAVLCKARTVFGQGFSGKERQSTRHAMAARTVLEGRASTESVGIGSRKTRTSIGILSQLNCKGTPVYTSKFRSCWTPILPVVWIRHSKKQILAQTLPKIFCRKHQELKLHTNTSNLYRY